MLQTHLQNSTSRTGTSPKKYVDLSSWEIGKTVILKVGLFNVIQVLILEGKDWGKHLVTVSRWSP